MEKRKGIYWLQPLLLLAFISAVSCSKSTENGKVSNLPGQNFSVSFAHHSGYITIDEFSQKSLFYWFFEAAEAPASKPLVLWLNGGPGCSSIGYGVAEEIGPFHVNTDGKSIYFNPYSWNQAANILFLDSPVGVGFSYSNNSDDVLSNGDERTAKDSLKFLQKWFKRFPQYIGRDFYITGESYAGHYVPQLAQAIVQAQNSEGDELIIDLKGYMVGNALTDNFHDYLGIFQFLWTTGLISDQTYKQLNVYCAFNSGVHPSEECSKAIGVATYEFGNIDPYSIFTPSCPVSPTLSRKNLFNIFDFGLHSSGKYDPCSKNHTTTYFNLPEVQKALHVNPVFAPIKWETCNDDISINWKDSPSTVIPIYHQLIKHGLRIWMFSGNTDAVIPVTSTRYSIDAMKLPTITPWRPWYDDDGQVGGWTEVYEGLTFVTIRGSGHMVPMHRPKQALVLLQSFLSGTSMPSLPTSVNS